ncbi:hypothetical protein TAL182_CH02757 [Rhizobium sp. TAL182]|nr:hypothetical protein TAL182_CH02757 [Rhizobium sp. TAL182]
MRAASASRNAAFFVLAVPFPAVFSPEFQPPISLFSAPTGDMTGQIPVNVAYLLFSAAFFHATVAFRTSARRIPRNEYVIAPRAWISL